MRAGERAPQTQTGRGIVATQTGRNQQSETRTHLTVLVVVVVVAGAVVCCVASVRIHVRMCTAESVRKQVPYSITVIRGFLSCTTVLNWAPGSACCFRLPNNLAVHAPCPRRQQSDGVWRECGRVLSVPAGHVKLFNQREIETSKYAQSVPTRCWNGVWGWGGGR